MIKLLKYNHAAMTKIFDLKKSYSLDELQSKYKLKIDEIKILFQPINFDWDELETKKKFVKQDKNDE